jgi:hypothetical protein
MMANKGKDVSATRTVRIDPGTMDIENEGLAVDAESVHHKTAVDTEAEEPLTCKATTFLKVVIIEEEVQLILPTQAASIISVLEKTSEKHWVIVTRMYSRRRYRY